MLDDFTAYNFLWCNVLDTDEKISMTKVRLKIKEIKNRIGEKKERKKEMQKKRGKARREKIENAPHQNATCYKLN